jgi:hypothetical protein
MTLKEKFDWYLSGGEKCQESEECATIADEYAIDFAEWCIYYREKNRNIYGQILHSLSKYDETYTTKELLEIYKKEKGL